MLYSYYKMSWVITLSVPMIVMIFRIVISTDIIDVSVINMETLIRIDKALTERGVFLAIGLDLDVDDNDSTNWQTLMIKISKLLFGVDEDIKDSLAMNVEKNDSKQFLFRGFIPFGKESGLPNSVFEPKEGFSYGYNVQGKDIENDMQV